MCASSSLFCPALKTPHTSVAASDVVDISVTVALGSLREWHYRQGSVCH